MNEASESESDKHPAGPIDETQFELARIRTELAAERTDLSLIRTGFTASSFGAGLTQIIGRGVWPSHAVDLLTIVFILTGAVSVQIGLYRLQNRLKPSPGRRDVNHKSRQMLIIGVSMVQLAMLAIVVMVISHM
jgi:uncharacterized membrane protein YidH (DUF202 family)